MLNTGLFSGQSAYRGYEYQILATAWLALQLMIHDDATGEIEVEPVSQEDVAADLNVDPNEAHTTVSVPGTSVRLQIQIKLRGAGTWTVAEFVKLLQATNTDSTRGPQPRARPVEILMTEPKTHYVLITNVGVHAGLRPYIITQLGTRSAATRLPGRIQVSCDPQDVASRIGVLPLQTPRLLTLEIKELLVQQCYVPVETAESCLRELTECVRDRLLGRSASTWPRADLIRVLERHGRRPDWSTRPFVAPSNLSHMEALLSERHCLVIIGPPGAGKTTIAQSITQRYRSMPNPVSVVTKAERIEGIRDALRKPGRHLFLLDDPWGHGELAPDAQLWLNELPKLFIEAHTDKCFVVTSRASTLAEAAGRELPLWLSECSTMVDATHYPADQRWQMLLAYLHGTRAWQFDFVTAHKAEILRQLNLPYAITLFATRLRSIHDEAQADLHRLLRDSNVEAVSRTVAREIRELSRDTAIHSAVALWAQLAVDNKTSETAASEFRRLIRRADPTLPVDLLKLVRWMVQSGWLTQQEGGLYAHPLVIGGLASLVDEERSVAEDTVYAVLSGLVADNRLPDVLPMLPHLAERNLQLPLEIRAVISEHVVTKVVNATHSSAFVGAFLDLQRFSKAGDPVSLLARTLTVKNVHVDVVPLWRGSSATLESIRTSADARIVAGKFIRWVLPWSDHYFGHPLMVWITKDLGWDVSSELAEAACAVVGTPTVNATLVLDSVLQTAEPPFERLLQKASEHLKRATVWYDQHREATRSAEQAEEDLAVASRTMEEPTDWFQPVNDALGRIVAERRRREGYRWIMEALPDDYLCAAWAAAITQQEPAGIDELDALLAARTTAPADAWKAVSHSGKRELAPTLLGALGQVPDDELHRCMVALFALVSPRELVEYLRGPGATLPIGRRALLFDISAARQAAEDMGSRRHRAALGAALTTMEETAVRFSQQAVTAPGDQIDEPPPDVLPILDELVSTGSPLLASKALAALAMAGRRVSEPAKRLLQNSDYQVRLCALRALAADRNSEAIQVLQTGLTDEDYRCRRSTMILLAAKGAAYTPLILSRESDASAPVREMCAQLIGIYQWADGLPTLCRLLQDHRDKNADEFSEAGPILHVAREAAGAFSAFTELPEVVLNQVCMFLDAGDEATKDVVVRYRLIRTVGLVTNHRISQRLIVHLNDQSRMKGIKHTGYPVRYATAWVIAYRLLGHLESAEDIAPEEMLGAASHTDGRLAGPALLVLGLLGKRALITMRTVLRGTEATPERVVLGLASCLVGRAPLPSNLLSELLPDGHPGLRVINWINSQPVPDDPRWQTFMGQDPEVGTWIQSIQENADVNPALRLALHVLARQRITTGVTSDDRHQHDLATQMDIMTLHTMFGGE